MTRYEELEGILKDVKEPKRSFLASLLKDFVWLEEQITELRKYPRYMISKNVPTRQVKLEVHGMLKDFQAQKNDIATKLLHSLDGDISEESPLLKALAKLDE